MRCIPVFLPPATHKAFYDGYCKDTLWPIFHNVIDVYGALVLWRSCSLVRGLPPPPPPPSR